MRSYLSHITVLLAIVVFATALPSLAVAGRGYDETVRGWQVTEVEPLVFLLEKPAKQQSAVFTVYPADVTAGESETYIRSSAFARDAKRIREKDLSLALGTDVRVAGDRRNFKNVSMGLIETRFTMDGRAILMTEHVWVKGHLVYHFVVTTKNVLEQPSEIHTAVLDEFKKDFFLEDRETASLLDIFIPRAEARESVGSSNGVRRRTPAPAAGGGSQTRSCKSRARELGRNENELRETGPSLVPSLSMRECGAGAARAWGEMKASMNRALTEMGRETERYMAFMRCEEINPNSASAVAERNRAARAARARGRFAQFTNFLGTTLGNSGMSEAYSNCIQSAGLAAGVNYFVRPAATAIVQMARSGAEAVRRNPQQAAMNALVLTNPALMATKVAMWVGTGDNVQQIYNYISREITGFTCLTPELQTQAYCAFATKALPELAAAAAIAVATGGAGTAAQAATRAARIAAAMQKGLAAARGAITTGSRRIAGREAAQAVERRAAAAVVAPVERRALTTTGRTSPRTRESAGSGRAASRSDGTTTTNRRSQRTAPESTTALTEQTRRTRAAIQTSQPTARSQAFVSGLERDVPDLGTASSLTDGERLAAAQRFVNGNRPLTETQSRRLLNSHDSLKVCAGQGYFEYSRACLSAKIAELTGDGGFTPDQANRLLRSGLAGDLPSYAQRGGRVLVPRSDGSVSVGTVVGREADGRIKVEWPENGGVASKKVPLEQLRPGWRSGDDVMVRRSSGAMQQARVTKIEGDRATVEFPIGDGTIGSKKVPLSELSGVERVAGNDFADRYADEFGALLGRRQPSPQVPTPDAPTPPAKPSLIPQTWEEADRRFANQYDDAFSFLGRRAPVAESVQRTAAAYRSRIDEIAPSTNADGLQYTSNGYWRTWIRGPQDIPDQGWKIHVGATPDSAARIAERLVPELRRRGITHKVVDNMERFATLDRADTQAGKFITVYPRTDAEARAFADLVKSATRDLNLQSSDFVAPPGERAIGTGVFARYGRLTGNNLKDPRTGREIPGTSDRMFDANGNIVPDVRGQEPSWVRNIFE